MLYFRFLADIHFDEARYSACFLVLTDMAHITLHVQVAYTLSDLIEFGGATLSEQPWRHEAGSASVGDFSSWGVFHSSQV